MLNDATVLKERYNLNVVDGDIGSVVEDRSKYPDNRKGIARLWSYVKPEVRKSRTEIIQQKGGPVKKLRWAALDQNKIRRLLRDVGEHTSKLLFQVSCEIFRGSDKLVILLLIHNQGDTLKSNQRLTHHMFHFLPMAN